LALTPGPRLGAYDITAAIGEGGMGQVFRARDTKLDRDVAIKILPEAFAHDAERLARFTREAKTLASLNHPNIAAIYGLEESGGTTALVMELVEGDDLSQRIARGAIPLDEALPIAKQIADALEAAHEQGIIHRDLKPANIRVRSDGAVKVLDFGLAKAMEPAAGSSPSMTMSPTLSLHATQAGIILGTAAYMSPEQARGKTIDRRADIWAFGVVLVELLIGRALFSGETITDIIAAIVTREPDLGALPAGTPSRVRDLVTRCLVKDPKQRLRDIGEARIAIERAIAEPRGLPPSAPVNSIRPALSFRMLPWALFASAVAGLAFVLALWAPWRRPSVPAPVRVSADLGTDASLSSSIAGTGAAAVLSPDGSLLAFVARRTTGAGSQLYVRHMDQLQTAVLTGTDNAASPFFSPDGLWLGFFADGKLKKIAVTGGSPVTLCEAQSGRGGSWSEDGTIVFSPSNTPGTSLWRVSAAGGKPEQLTTLADGEVTQRFPQVLRGGKAILYMSSNVTGAYEDANLIVQPLPSGPRKVVVHGGFNGRYLASGHLVYVHGGTLFAVPFDLDRLELTGQAVPAVDGVAAPVGGGAQFSVAGNGILAFVPGLLSTNAFPIEWMDREGKTRPLRATPTSWDNTLFSPDGRRIAWDNEDSGKIDVWVSDWPRDVVSRLTTDAGQNQKPVWTPDGARIVYTSDSDKKGLNLYWRRADGSGEVQRLTESVNTQYPSSWHPSGRFLAFTQLNAHTNFDLMILPMDGDETSGWKPGKPYPFLASPFVETEPMFSPDGRWIAYQGNETGRNEVYVKPFPGPGGKWQISTTGGTMPTWSRSRHELLYATPSQQIMVVPYMANSDSFQAEQPRVWSPRTFLTRLRGPISRSFDLHPDGDRVALTAAPEIPVGARQEKIVFIFNFFEELRRIAPVTKR
jgi:serine/threonine protein kinase